MCISDEKNTGESKSTKYPLEGKCLLPKPDSCSPKTIRPSPVDICPHNKYPSNLSKRIQSASTAAAAASIKEPASPGSTIPSDTPKPSSNSKQLDPPIIIPCTFKESSPSQLDHPPNDTEKKVTSDSRPSCPEPKPVCKDNAMLVKQSCPESKPVCKDTDSLVRKSCPPPSRPTCKDTATIIKPPPKRNPFKTVALATAALVGGYVLYETVLKDYILGVPECDCGCNKKK